jgi:hypothetical protein
MDKEDRQKIQRIKQIISEKLRYGYRFEPVVSHKEREEEPAPNIDFNNPESRESITHIPAYLRVDFRLSNVRRWCGLDVNNESSDKLILTALDALAKSGAVRFLSIGQIHDQRYDEIHFSCESGRGWSNFACTNRVDTVQRLYVDRPLVKQERAKGKGILDVKTAVEGIWARSRKLLELKYGKPTDTDIEKKLWRDKHNAETELGMATLAIAKALKEKKNAKEV